jgi:hypothetical protein
MTLVGPRKCSIESGWIQDEGAGKRKSGREKFFSLKDILLITCSDGQA